MVKNNLYYDSVLEMDESELGAEGYPSGFGETEDKLGGPVIKTGKNRTNSIEWNNQLSTALFSSETHISPKTRKLVDLSLSNKLNRKVSFYMVSQSIDAFEKKSRKNKLLNEDILFLKKIIGKITAELDNGEIDEDELKRLIILSLGFARDRKISTNEMMRLFYVLNDTWNLEIDEKRMKAVLYDLKKKERRKEIKKIIKEGVGEVAVSVMENPLSRRMVVFTVRKIFSMYERELLNKLPSQVDKQQIKGLIENTLSDMLDNNMKADDIAQLAEMAFESILDKKVTEREVAHIIKYLATQGYL